MKFSGKAIILLIIILFIGVTGAAAAAGWIDLKKIAGVLPTANSSKEINQLQEQNNELLERLAELEEELYSEKEQRLQLEQALSDYNDEQTAPGNDAVNDLKDYQEVGEYYAGMEPLIAAGILARMAPEVAAEILTGMDKEAAGQILAVMEPERAVQVTEMIAICEAQNRDR